MSKVLINLVSLNHESLMNKINIQRVNNPIRYDKTCQFVYYWFYISMYVSRQNPRNTSVYYEYSYRTTILNPTDENNNNL